MVSAFGYGEATFGIVPTEKKDEFEFSFKKVGNVTTALFKMKRNDIIGVRGPFGKGYPLNKLEGKDIILVAGGIGFPPIKALLMFLLMRRKRYGRIELYYGARTPEDIVYKKELREWSKRRDLKVKITVDEATGKWKGNVGVVTTILEDLKVNKRTYAFICGPPIMMKFVTQKLVEKGLKENRIYASMERLMQCGIGACGHCNISHLYVCKDGPSMRVDKLLSLVEKPW